MYKSLLCGVLSLCLSSLWAQTTIGSVENFSTQLASTYEQKARGNNFISLQLEDGTTLTGKILSKKIEGLSTIYEGTIEGQKAGFSFTLKNGKIEGDLVISSEKKAFKYITNEVGNVVISEDNIHNYICIDKGLQNENPSERIQETTPAISNGVDINKLESYPTAPAVVLLDFDGHTVSDSWWTNNYNSGQPFTCTPANLTDEQMYEIWEVVSEDFRPFNINITTDPTVFDAVVTTMRQRVVITRTSDWQTVSSTGIARIGAFNKSDSPVFSFPSGLSSNLNRAEVTSHEVGHALGLYHDGATGPDATNYYRGHGEWCTIMGAGYSDDITQWSKGEYDYANNTQDDIAIISGSSNNFGFREDDHGNTKLTGTAITQDIVSNTIEAKSNSGVISERTDVDVWLFGTSGGTIDLTVSAFHVKPNLDIEAKLYDSNDQLIATSDVSALFHAEFNQTLSAGVYYIVIDGVGYGDLTTGYSDYGSLGHYDVSGTIENFYSTLTAPPTVNITSPANQAIIQMTALSPVTLKANAADSDGTIKEVFFEIEGEQIIASLQGQEYIAQWTPKDFKIFKVDVYAIDDLNSTAYHSINVTISEQLVDNNIKLVSVDDANILNCATSLNFQLNVENRGNNTITNYDVEVYLNDKLVETASQTTNLTSTQTELVTLNPINLSTSGNQKIKFKLVLNQEEAPTDNEMEKTYNISFGESYDFYISTRSANSAISWTVKDGNNQLIADQTAPSSENGDLTVQNFCLASGCFDIVINDPFKDGTCTVEEWQSGKEYCQGLQVVNNGIIYEAGWCTTNEPGAAQWNGWTEIGACAVTYDDDFLGVKNSQTQQNEFEVKVKDFANSINETICTQVITNTFNTETSKITVFPNPFDNIISIHGITTGTVKIINQLGEIVFTQHTTESINTTFLPKGLYILSVQNQEINTQFKIVKR